MVQAKTELFDSTLAEMARVFKTLGHPARLKILQFLAESETCITGDISEDLPLGRTTVNQHLKELKDAGLIEGHIKGATTRYCLVQDRIREIRKIMIEFIGNIELDNYKCR